MSDKPGKDWIFDFETLGTNPAKHIAVNCSSLRFDWSRFCSDNPYTLRELIPMVNFYKFDLEEQKALGWEIDKRCVKEFWMKQAPEVQAQLKPSKNDLMLAKFAKNILNDVRDLNRWWARGAALDAPMLLKIMDQTGDQEAFEYYAAHWKFSDTKTWFDAKFNFETRNDFVPVADEEFWDKVFVKHDSRFDVAADVLRLQTVHRVENDMEQTKR